MGLFLALFSRIPTESFFAKVQLIQAVTAPQTNCTQILCNFNQITNGLSWNLINWSKIYMEEQKKKKKKT